MGTALFELEGLLIKQKNLTAEELNVLNGSKSKAIRQFTLNALVGGGGTLAATWNRGKLPSLCLAAGVAVTSGLLGLHRSLDSSADDILSLDGSRMQKELATIMLRKLRDNPLMKHRLSKHFYSEEVYYDTSSEPTLRWRFRNFFSDNVAYDQSTQQNTHPQEYGSDSHQEPPTDSQTGGNKFESSMTGFASSPATVNSGNYLEADPLGCFFGSATTEASEEIDKPVSPSKGSNVERRGHGRARRRRRMQRDDNSDDS